MPFNRPRYLRNVVFYQIYVRNHGANGTFKDVQSDLKRIQSLGVDIIYLLPIHPIGQLNKKGSLGCPYAIRDYRAINSDYGTEQNFKDLVDATHALGMKVIIDVVFNHTAPDARYVLENPDWYNRDGNGEPFTTTPDWSDIIDLKHPNQGLWDYLIGSLVYWIKFGVDGFRCDVASLLPIQFWKRARQECAVVNPDTIWLAESVHLGFVRHRRRNGLTASTDSELFQVFDILYDYDIWPVFQAAVRGALPPARYIEMLQLQESIYPNDFIKMRCVENHDQKRIQALARSPQQAMAWTALAAFNSGPFFIHAGQESAAVTTPSLFEIDKVKWDDYTLQDTLTTLAKLKKEQAQLHGRLDFITAEPVITAVWHHGSDSLFGIFNVETRQGMFSLPLPDGRYQELLSNKQITVRNNQIELPESAYIFRCAFVQEPKEFSGQLLDFNVS